MKGPGQRRHPCRLGLGHPAGLAWLTQQLVSSDGDTVAAAASALAAELGPASYNQLAALWRHPGRDCGARQAALGAMAIADPFRAHAELMALLSEVADGQAQPPDEDTLEQITRTLAEGNARAALPILGRLRARLAEGGDALRSALALVAAAEDILSASDQSVGL